VQIIYINWRERRSNFTYIDSTQVGLQHQELMKEQMLYQPAPYSVDFLVIAGGGRRNRGNFS
jgi:hypothetical protein